MELTHNDWLKSLRENDGAKWVLEEDITGRGRYYRIDPGEEQARIKGKEGPAAIRNRKIRQQMAKRVSREPKSFTWRLGYNHCIGQFSGDSAYPWLSGSSLNRKKIVGKKADKNDSMVMHKMSARSKGKIKDKATAFFRSIPKDRIFLTLTFIADVTDQQGNKILNKFLTVVRKERPGFEFLRVAERQKETGRIHFHVLMNKRLAVRRYNALWVLQQYNEGLVGKRENGEVISKEEIVRRYHHDMTEPFRKHDPDSVMAVLNPLDVEKVYGIQGLANYLTKYVTKQDDQEFACLTWHCSRRVSRLFTREVVSPSTFAYLQTFNNYKVDTKTGECFPPSIYKGQFFTMIYVHNKTSPLSRMRAMEQVNKWLIKNFEPDKLPLLDDYLYRKILYNEKEKIKTDLDLAGIGG